MNKKSSSKYFAKVAKTIYPKEYVGYVILSVLIITFIIYLGFLSTENLIGSHLVRNEMIFVILAYLFFTYISFYFITTIIFLSLKRIKLEVKETEIIIDKVFVKRKILITDIESIRIGKASWKYPLSYVTIKRKKNGNRYSNKYLIFPVSWFSLADIRYVLEFIKSYNKNVKIDGGYDLY